MVARQGRVEGKVAIVTGAGSTPGPGVATGWATAIVLARELTTPLLLAELGQTPETEFRQQMAAAAAPLGTEGDGWDIGWAAAFLASDQARWITGVTLPVDGGVLAVTPLLMARHLRAVAAPQQRE